MQATEVGRASDIGQLGPNLGVCCQPSRDPPRANVPSLKPVVNRRSQQGDGHAPWWLSLVRFGGTQPPPNVCRA
jgi:hypothetical protein